MSGHQNIIDNLSKNDILDEKLVLSMNDSALFYKIGVYFEKRENYSKMKNYLDLAISVNPKNVDALFHLGLYYQIYKRNHDMSVKYYQNVIDLDSKRAAAFYNIGWCYSVLKKDTDMAIQYYELASELGCAKATYNMALRYCKIKKYDLAKKYWLKAIDQGYVEAIMRIAEHYHKIEENHSLARNYCKMLIEKNDGTCSSSRVNEIIHNVAYDLYFEENNMLDAEELFLYVINDEKYKNSVVRILMTYSLSKNDMSGANKYFNMIDWNDCSDSYDVDADVDDHIAVTYLMCMNNKATVKKLLKFFKITDGKFTDTLVKNHCSKLKLITSHLNYLISIKFEKMLVFPVEFSDVRASN